MYRQAAPFSRGAPTASPRRPGRKPGAAYGPRAHRRSPPRVDETHDAPPPAQCPRCQRVVRRLRVALRYQDKLPVKGPVGRAFRIAIGQCTRAAGGSKGGTRCRPPMDLGIVEVAERVGYSSARTFSTAFSRQVGKPPSRYAATVRT